MCFKSNLDLNKEFKGDVFDANSSYLLRPDKKLCGDCNEYEIFLRLKKCIKVNNE